MSCWFTPPFIIIIVGCTTNYIEHISNSIFFNRARYESSEWMFFHDFGFRIDSTMFIPPPPLCCEWLDSLCRNIGIDVDIPLTSRSFEECSLFSRRIGRHIRPILHELLHALPICRALHLSTDIHLETLGLHFANKHDFLPL